MESFRTSLASRTFSRTHFEVFGLEGQVFGLGLEASSLPKLPCPDRLEDSTLIWIVKILLENARNLAENLRRLFLLCCFGDRHKNSFEDLFWGGDCLKKFFFVWKTLAPVSLVLGVGLEHSCPWPRESLSSIELLLALASDFVCVVGLVSSTPPLVSTRWAKSFHHSYFSIFCANLLWMNLSKLLWIILIQFISQHVKAGRSLTNVTVLNHTNYCR